MLRWFILTFPASIYQQNVFIDFEIHRGKLLFDESATVYP